MEKSLFMSVHQLVDFLLRTGDIDNRVYNKTTMSEGTRLHGFYQSKQKDNYLSEYYLKEAFKVDDFTITLDGRADGIILDGDKVIIDEIKTTISPLDEYYESQKEWHLGQAKCYALMYAHLFKLDEVGVKLTYIHQLENTKMVKNFSFKTKVLEEYVTNLLKEYLEFYRLIFQKIEDRNESAKTLKFPYPGFRKGQKELAKYAYGIATNGGILFAEAPTGIGKTMSTLYPFAKSFKDEENQKIFYLTAKNSGRVMAYEASSLLLDKGLKASAIVITAKDKICFCPGKGCNPDECPFAKDYYTHIRKAIVESIKTYNLFSPEVITEIAKHYAICPFEMQLDLSLYVDIIICDYNYLFDPTVYLRRYFDEDASKMLVLVDESHNLVDRAREMYSASFDSYKFKMAKKAVKHLEHKKIKNAIKRISKLFNKFDDFVEGETIITDIAPTDLAGIDAYLLAATDVNKHHHDFVDDYFTEFFFDLNKFSKLYAAIDDSFTLYVTKSPTGETKITLYCLDPRGQVKASLNTKRIARASDVLKIGDEVDAVVLNVSKEDQKVSLGIRQTGENPWDTVMDKYPLGSRVKGRVRNFTSYGAFVELEEGVDGMIHVSDMDWSHKINHPSEVLKKGDEVEAIVLEVSPENQRISLGLKQAKEDPWSGVASRYRIGQLVKGSVNKLASFGAFIQLEDGVDGLVHISQISDERIGKVSDVLHIGDEVEARVVRIDPVERRIGLSIKAAKMAEDDFQVDDTMLEGLRPGEDLVDLAGAFDAALGDKGEIWSPGGNEEEKGE